ncbi:unnamed protein product [Gordionus sp. m RMFG-2023]
MNAKDLNIQTKNRDQANFTETNAFLDSEGAKKLSICHTTIWNQNLHGRLVYNERYMNYKGEFQPWLRKSLILVSLIIFMIYFCMLREENETDEILGKNLRDYFPPDHPTFHPDNAQHIDNKTPINK